MTLKMLRSALSGPLEADHMQYDEYKMASVLVVTYGDPPHVIMTAKPSHMRLHAGEISFPGGKVEDGDADLLYTALRETWEEIGLRIGRSQVVGRLDTVTTLNSGFAISPFVAVVDGQPDLLPNSEVDQILRIPLEEFLDTVAPDTEHNAPLSMFTFEHDGRIVWGASARILKQMRDLLSARGCLQERN